MARKDPLDPIERTVIVPIAPDRAFEIFTTELDRWWPKEYTWSALTLETIAIEPRVGGRCYELGPHRFQLDWGRVLKWEPPKRLAFTWQIDPNRVPQPDPERISEVEVTFEEEAGKTRVTLTHSGLENHGEESEAYRDGLAATEGWSLILGRYAAAARNS